jgi:hypothetical protein
LAFSQTAFRSSQQLIQDFSKGCCNHLHESYRTSASAHLWPVRTISVCLQTTRRASCTAVEVSRSHTNLTKRFLQTALHGLRGNCCFSGRLGLIQSRFAYGSLVPNTIIRITPIMTDNFTYRSFSRCMIVFLCNPPSGISIHNWEVKRSKAIQAQVGEIQLHRPES